MCNKREKQHDGVAVMGQHHAEALHCRVAASHAGQRLDSVLSLLYPLLSMRARRRLWDTHTVLVNEKYCPAGYMVRAGDALCVRPREHGLAPEATLLRAADCGASVIERQGALIFLYKPAGLHTATLDGRGGPSLEALLPELCAETDVHLVNRLDCGTSGIVVAACSEHAVQQWRRMESAGLCEKRYIAVLCGHLPETVTIRRELDTAKRRISRVLPMDSTDTVRHTRITPLGHMSAGAVREVGMSLFSGSDLPATSLYDAYTVVACSIAKGARHQIRAHAHWAGFPLWGDTLYTDTEHSAQDLPHTHTFLLHHGLLSMPAAHVPCTPAWLQLLPETLQNAINNYLYK